jgi:hypothetical protein
MHVLKLPIHTTPFCFPWAMFRSSGSETGGEENVTHVQGKTRSYKSRELVSGTILLIMGGLTAGLGNRCAGYVPADVPGASSYFTPRYTIKQSNEIMHLGKSSSRNPVIASLDQQIAANPMRVRTPSAMPSSCPSARTSFQVISHFLGFYTV